MGSLDSLRSFLPSPLFANPGVAGSTPTSADDLRFPELFRELAWTADCDLVLHPSAFVRDATFDCYHTFVTTRAVENGVYMLSVNYAGDDFGDSIAVPPWVGPVPGFAEAFRPVSIGTEEGVVPITVDSRALSAVRSTFPYRRDVSPTLAKPKAQRVV